MGSIYVPLDSINAIIRSECSNQVCHCQAHCDTVIIIIVIALVICFCTTLFCLYKCSMKIVEINYLKMFHCNCKGNSNKDEKGGKDANETVIKEKE